MPMFPRSPAPGVAPRRSATLYGAVMAVALAMVSVSTSWPATATAVRTAPAQAPAQKFVDQRSTPRTMSTHVWAA